MSDDATTALDGLIELVDKIKVERAQLATETAEVTTEWKDFSYEFKADTVLKQQNRISFILGGDKGKVWIKGLSLTAK